MKLKFLRKQKGFTQKECSEFLGIPLRTYVRYENNENSIDSLKYKYMVDKLESYNSINEYVGVLSVQEIKERCSKVFENYEIEYCYLFGSYAKGKATPLSDVDLLVAAPFLG